MGEIDYYGQIEEHLSRIGHYENVLLLQGTDPEFCTASMKVYKAGYVGGKSYKIVAALIAQSAAEYLKNKSSGLLFLSSLEKQLSAK